MWRRFYMQIEVGLPEEAERFAILKRYGQPFASPTPSGNWFLKRCREAGVVDRSAHGLRKYFSAKLAEDGASDREIMAWTGHRTSKEVDRYTRSANQERLAVAAQKRRESSKIAPPISGPSESESKVSPKSLNSNANGK